MLRIALVITPLCTGAERAGRWTPSRGTMHPRIVYSRVRSVNCDLAGMNSALAALVAASALVSHLAAPCKRVKLASVF